jgi:hypothetical protein
MDIEIVDTLGTIQVLLPSYPVNKCIMFDVVIIPLAGQLVSQRLNIHYGLKTNRASFTTISHTCINKLDVYVIVSLFKIIKLLIA